MTVVETVIELLRAYRPGFVPDEQWQRWLGRSRSRGGSGGERGAGAHGPQAAGHQAGGRQAGGRQAGGRQAVGRQAGGSGPSRRRSPEPEGERRGAGTDRGPSPALARCYAELGVPHGASLRQVRRAWLRLIRRHHPDLCGPDRERQRLGTELVQRFNAAYDEIRKHSPG